ncbi:HAD hydrolase family protein [Variovorax sp. WDL1]|uniref:HAD hydrolase family protein n=1 Tax=Variovorax sp. WDL1 TaxID=207745 RepID=UPI001E520443|nr:HAD hydrolase family protein [Variovorax sp. WDL1]
MRHGKTLPDANVEAAKRLKAAGIAMTLISARPMSGIRWLADALELEERAAVEGAEGAVHLRGSSRWPPKPKRIADSSLSPKVLSTRLR